MNQAPTNIQASTNGTHHTNTQPARALKMSASYRQQRDVGTHQRNSLSLPNMVDGSITMHPYSNVTADGNRQWFCGLKILPECSAEALNLPNWGTETIQNSITLESRKNVKVQGCGALEITERRPGAHSDMSLDSMTIQSQNIIQKDGKVQTYCRLKIIGTHPQQPAMGKHDGTPSTPRNSIIGPTRHPFINGARRQQITSKKIASTALNQRITKPTPANAGGVTLCCVYTELSAV